MADNSVPTLDSESRVEDQHSATSSPPRASPFTAYNLNSQGEPHRLRHVTKEVMQKHLDEGTVCHDDGPEPGFQDQPHGTDVRAPPPPDQASEQDDTVIDEDDGKNAETGVPEVPVDPEYPKFYNGNKRKRVDSPRPAELAVIPAAPLDFVAASSATSAVDDEPRRGRKPGTSRKETQRPWTDAECIALIKLYVDHPRATHKIISEMHHGEFWCGDPSWEGRTFSACSQRMIALNDKSRDRARLPGVLAELRSAFQTAGRVETHDGVEELQRGAEVGDMDEEDGGPYGDADEDEVGEVDAGDAISRPQPNSTTQAGGRVSSTFDDDDAEAARLLLSMSSRR